MNKTWIQDLLPFTSRDVSLSLSLQVLTTRKRPLSDVNLPASLIGLLKALRMSLSRCLLGPPLSLFLFIFPSEIIFYNPSLLFKWPTYCISEFFSSQSCLATAPLHEVLLLYSPLSKPYPDDCNTVVKFRTFLGVFRLLVKKNKTFDFYWLPNSFRKQHGSSSHNTRRNCSKWLSLEREQKQSYSSTFIHIRYEGFLCSFEHRTRCQPFHQVQASFHSFSVAWENLHLVWHMVGPF